VLDAYKAIWDLTEYGVCPENVDEVITAIEGCIKKNLAELIEQEEQTPFA